MGIAVPAVGDCGSSTAMKNRILDFYDEAVAWAAANLFWTGFVCGVAACVVVRLLI